MTQTLEDKTKKCREERDLKFLKKLDERLCKKFHTTYCNVPVLDLIAKDGVTITQEEIEKLLKIITERDDLVFYPTNINTGFRVGFQVSQGYKPMPGVEAERERLLTFGESQLPKEYDFKKLSKTFLNKRNIQLMTFFDMAPDKKEMRDKGNYEY